MKIGPKYKIARRLGAPIFEKTQTAKFSLSEEKRGRKFSKPKSEFGLQMAEKQKARFFYGITEKQFKNYVKKVLSNSKIAPAVNLYSVLESRLDNTIWRVGLAPTHRSARLMVSHGHITVNDRRVYSPSYLVVVGDKIGIRPKSRQNGMFRKDDEEEMAVVAPAWVSFDKTKGEAEIKAKANLSEAETMFDMNKVIEFYQR